MYTIFTALFAETPEPTREQFLRFAARSYAGKPLDDPNGPIEEARQLVSMALQELQEFLSLSPAALRADYEKACANDREMQQKLRAHDEEVRQRYAPLLQIAKEWTPPTVQHVPLRDWLQRNLETIMERVALRPDLAPVPFETWRSITEDGLWRLVELRRSRVQAIEKECREARDWWQQFEASLPGELRF